VGQLGVSRGRVTRLVGVLAMVLCCVGAAAGSAAADDFTWSGADTTTPGGDWSDPANWVGDVAPAPSSTVGTLTFPESSCCGSENDVTGLTVGKIDIGASNDGFGGDAITLDGGLTIAPPGDTDEDGADILDTPITLGAAQTWELNNSLAVGEGISGDYPLTVELGSSPADGSSNDLEADDDIEVGALSITDGNFSLRTDVNSADGNPVMLTNAGLASFGTHSIGALSSQGSTVSVSEPGSGIYNPVSLSVASATFDSGSALEMPLGLQFIATGSVNLGGSDLDLAGQAYPENSACWQGVTTLVSTSGTLTGTFGNAPEGATVSDGCADYAIDYNRTGATKTVTATYLGLPVTESVATLPESPVTNQTVAVTATLTSTDLPGALGGDTVDFEEGGETIPGCGAVSITYVNADSDYTASCQAGPFAAASSPVALSAVVSGTVVASGSDSDSLTVAKDATSTNVAVMNGGLIYTATVTPALTGPVLPSGSVEFLADGVPIGSCTSVPLRAGSSRHPSPSATCTVSAAAPAPSLVTAQYSGDGNFTGSSSATTPGRSRLAPPRGGFSAYGTAGTTISGLSLSGSAPVSKAGSGVRSTRSKRARKSSAVSRKLMRGVR
jgi:hypothetical protein